MFETLGQRNRLTAKFFSSYDGPQLDEKALLRAAEGGLSSLEYVELCRWLATRLKPLCGLEESITSGPGEILNILKQHYKKERKKTACFCVAYNNKNK